jgi:hypothetical protein
VSAVCYSQQLRQAGKDAGAQQLNQGVRWVNTKEEHASKIIDVANYLFAQRLKAEAFASKEDYFAALEAHHLLLQAAVKCKQTVSSDSADMLDFVLDEVAKLYTPRRSFEEDSLPA